MNPNVLRQRVRKEILAHIDADAWAHCRTTEAAEQESLNAYVRAWPRR